MERRLAITYIVSATTTFGIACVAIAITGGGLFANAAPPRGGGKHVEIVDDYIVVHTSTSVALTDPAATPVDVQPVTPGSPISRVRAPGSPTAPVVVAAGAAAPSPTDTAVADAGNQAASQPDQASAAGSPSPDGSLDAPVAASPVVPAKTSPVDAPAPATTATPSPPSTTPVVAATRPPIPDGCVNPRFRNGAWKCDDE